LILAAIAKSEGAASEGLLDGENYGLEPIGLFLKNGLKKSAHQ